MSDDIYRLEVCRELKHALDTYQAVVDQNTNLLDISHWRRRVMDLCAILQKLDDKEMVKS